MSEEPQRWLDTVGIDYDRAKADALLEAQDWQLLRREIEIRKAGGFSNDPRIQEWLDAEKLEYGEAVGLVCADPKYFPGKRELWLHRADDWERRLREFRAEWDAARFAETSLDEAAVAAADADWRQRLHTMHEDLDGFFHEIKRLFPLTVNRQSRALKKKATARRADLTGLLLDLQQEFKIVSEEKKRRPMLIKIGLGILLGGGLLTWWVLRRGGKGDAGGAPLEAPRDQQ